MKGLDEYWLPYVISNIAALIILGLSIWRPRVGRLLLFLLFAWASVTNLHYAHTEPRIYIDYADMSLPIYARFINGWFATHATAMVSAIAIGQVLIALGLLLSNWWVKLACLGAILFLLGIAPLGVGSAFPFSLVTIAACMMVLAKDRKQVLWKKTPA